MLPGFPNSWWNLERHNEPRKSVWLFNISKDPFERLDLSEHRPDIVRKLLARLVYYNRTAVPVRYPLEDPRADPSLSGGVWLPWVGEEEEEEDNRGKTYHVQQYDWRKKQKPNFNSIHADWI